MWARVGQRSIEGRPCWNCPAARRRGYFKSKEPVCAAGRILPLRFPLFLVTLFHCESTKFNLLVVSECAIQLTMIRTLPMSLV
jgi:hypothetical protein